MLEGTQFMVYKNKKRGTKYDAEKARAGSRAGSKCGVDRCRAMSYGIFQPFHLTFALHNHKDALNRFRG